MKIFRELTFEGRPEGLLSFLDGVESAFCDGWRRDEQLEERILEGDSGQGAFRDRAYFCPKSDRHAAAHLWIAAQNPTTLFVQNIMPIERRRLLYDEYNALVKEFHDRFTIGPASEHEITVMLGPDCLSLEEMVPATVFDRLVAFTLAANPHTASDHPDDRQRWQNFIIKTHETDCDLTREALRRWLVEDKLWPDDVATELAEQYEFGRSLLAHEHMATA